MKYSYKSFFSYLGVCVLGLVISGFYLYAKGAPIYDITALTISTFITWCLPICTVVNLWDNINDLYKNTKVQNKINIINEKLIESQHKQIQDLIFSQASPQALHRENSSQHLQW